jgi:hypothetical protein
MTSLCFYDLWDNHKQYNCYVQGFRDFAIDINMLVFAECDELKKYRFDIVIWFADNSLRSYRGTKQTKRIDELFAFVEE